MAEDVLNYIEAWSAAAVDHDGACPRCGSPKGEECVSFVADLNGPPGAMLKSTRLAHLERAGNLPDHPPTTERNILTLVAGIIELATNVITCGPSWHRPELTTRLIIEAEHLYDATQ